MKVAMLAPITWRVPPRHYGPWERVVSLLTEALVARGVEVTLFATSDALTQAQLAAVCPRPYGEEPSLDPKVWECLHIASLFERAAEFDLIHNHFDFLPLSYSELVATPMITTIQGFASESILPVYQRYNRSNSYVAISESSRHPSLEYLATVYPGINLDEFTLGTHPDDYLLFFGRIHPAKGVVEAIEVAQQSGRRLLIAGIVQDEAYFRQRVEPRLDGEQICYLGSVGSDQRNELLGNAHALLHLIQFDEPFGLSMIEAMACGTPVIAYPRGAVPEIVQHGKTGWIVADLAAAVTAVEAVANLNRCDVRAAVAANFSCERMTDTYLELYQAVQAEPFPQPGTQERQLNA